MNAFLKDIHLLKIENLTKNFGNYRALNNLSIQVPKGSIYGLLGPNGAGKTTLIRMVNQILLPDSGTIYLDNEPLAPEHISMIGYLPEERGLYKSMKVGEQALYLARLKGLTKAEATERLNYWFEKFEITDWWDKKIQELSKGMAQKIQFIVTVLHQPKLLIFDEPFSGFDPVNAKLIGKEIIALRDQGTTIIFSTHRMESVEEMCDYVALIHKSEKVLEGPLKKIQLDYKTNLFEVGIQCLDKEKVQKEISSEFLISEANFASLNDSLRLNVSLPPEMDQHTFFNRLTSFGPLTHFTEKIPTMNEIFLEAVSKRNDKISA
ncbi:ABC transporter ATP-binding protein [Flavicella sediminum]|uniref:ABC transporter ATP-binding protein n=1 Tax=Flavicella sediminum TaxID=2585141 RepID=UPI001FB7E853|nr:ABC transporter ATP-binding protein [Flavicella sediminum]